MPIRGAGLDISVYKHFSALKAGVPLGMACIDYAAKEVSLVSYATLSGELDPIAMHTRCVRTCRGLKSGCTAPIEFLPAE